MADDDEILFSVRGRVGFVLLNRPKALNALTHAMCVAMKERLDAWAADDKIEAVVVEGAGEKGFCAGGDVVRIARSGQEGTREWQDFFRDEYRNNHAIAHFPKPYVALIDGITMGGGVGVSVHGNYRVATENTLFAMPETGLGLIPDVGGSHFLPRLPGATGMYLALTGYRARAADCLYLGVATHFMPAETLAEIKARLIEARGLDDVARVGVMLDEAAADPGTPPLAAHRTAIDRHFSRDSVEAILKSLSSRPTEWATRTADELRTKSPTSMKVTFEALRRGAQLDVGDCLKMEFRIVNRILTHDRDFYEGVRAILVEKDRNPKWDPPSLDAVGDADVAAHFADLGEDELSFA